MPAAVEISGSRNITVRQCEFTMLGGSGLSIGSGSRDSSVTGSRFDDISGSGIMLGGVLATDNATADALRLAAVNNLITNTPREYLGAVGIFAGYLSEGLIAHNQLENLSYLPTTYGLFPYNR